MANENPNDIYPRLVDEFFAGADAFRRDSGEDPAAVAIPDWALHALVRSPVMGASLRWPTRNAPYPESFFGLPVVGVGDAFLFFGKTDEAALAVADKMPVEWPWTAVWEPEE